ncbi:uncharacterized protein LOC115581680 [Sparus aurata]|uniref:uncharacterized protein LOC115581680 n=1 Tax=Sparus aurata TaxID=8175 RepID=UPI0011C1D0FB|nr:uncharacterized protein LOC115581680 [Sparus aurata]
MYAPDTGIGDMPPVEREMAALTSLGPERVTANPRCPVKECEKTDRLVCRSYNAATRAAHSGNALAILLAALRRTANPEDQDTMSLIDSALVTHSQLTRDVGVVMSSAMMSRRQIWACWTKLNSLAALEIVCGAPLAEPRLPGMVLGVPSIQTIPLALARSRGGSMLVSRPLVIHNRRHAGSSGFSPVLPVKRGPTGDAPPGVRDDRLGPHRGGGSAAAVSSQLCLDSWEERVLDPWVLATVSTGYRIQFRRRPPPFSGVRMTTVRDPVQEKILAGEIATLLQKDAIMRVEPSEQLAGFYSLYFLVSKKDGGLRPILDLRRLNAFIKVLPFKMLTTSQILEAVEKGDWFTSVDLRDAYFHVPICPDHRPFLRFAFQGRAYQFKVLPFGLSLSPRVFTRVIGAALRPLQLSVPGAQSELDENQPGARSAGGLCWAAPGLCRNVRVTHLSEGGEHPGPSVPFSPRQEAGVGPVPEAVGHDLGCSGRCSSWSPQGSAFAEMVQCSRPPPEITQTCKGSGDTHVSPGFAPMEGHEAPSPGCPPWEYSFEKDGGNHRCLPDRVGSSVGTQDGAWCLGTPLGGGAHQRLGTEGSFPGVEGAPSFHPGQACPGTHGQFLHGVPCEPPGGHLLFWAAQHLASLRAVYIPGIANRAADLLSRTGPLPGEWRLHPEVVALLWAQFGMACADLFASAETTHCRMWFSLLGRGGPLGLDALSHEWPDGLLYAFPPLPLVSQVLHRVTMGRYKVLLIAPRWPRKYWFPRLLRLVHGQPWALPGRVDLLSQAEGQIWHPRPALLQLWAWPLLSPGLRD